MFVWEGREKYIGDKLKPVHTTPTVQRAVENLISRCPGCALKFLKRRPAVKNIRTILTSEKWRREKKDQRTCREKGGWTEVDYG